MTDILPELMTKYGKVEKYQRGSVLVRQGMDLECLYYITKGRVKVEQAVMNGKSLLFAFSGVGNWLGDLELFNESTEANSTVSAVTEVEVVSFSLKSMQKNLSVYPELSEIFARSLAKKMWAYSKKSAVNLLCPLLERYAAYLYEMSADSLELPIALETSAGLLGSGERQLQRVIAILDKRGIIKRSGRTLTIIDRAMLKNIAKDLID